MPTRTYTPIARQTLSSNQTTVTFSSIPSTYTDLVFIFDPATVADGKTLQITFNGDSSALYSLTELNGTGTSVISTRTTGSTFLPVTQYVGASSSLNKSMIKMNIQNYANTSVFKTVIGRIDSASTSYPGAADFVGLYRSTNAITSVAVTTNNSQQLSGSTFTLYGIKAGS